MITERQNWTPKYENGRFVVVDKLTNDVINTSQDYGFTSEEKCWNWIRNQQRQVGINISEPGHAIGIPHADPLY